MSECVLACACFNLYQAPVLCPFCTGELVLVANCDVVSVPDDMNRDTVCKLIVSHSSREVAG